MYLVASVFKDNNFCVCESKYTVTFFKRGSQLSPFARVNEMYRDVLNKRLLLKYLTHYEKKGYLVE